MKDSIHPQGEENFMHHDKGKVRNGNPLIALRSGGGTVTTDSGVARMVRCFALSID